MTDGLIRLDVEPTPELLAECLANDKIKRHGKLRQIVDVIIRVDGAYTLFIDGAWGSGKTYMVKQIIELLKHKNTFLETEVDPEVLEGFLLAANIEGTHKEFIPIYFNAWDNDHYDDPLCPLLCEMAIQLDKSAKTKDRDYKSALFAILDSLLPISVGEAATKLSGKDILKEYKDRLELREKFDELVNDALATDYERLVLFIDELDRCRPEFAIQTLEQTKRLFNNNRVIVVVSTDAVRLAYSLAGVYGESFDSKKYLERFYDLKIELNKIQPMEYLGMLGYTDNGYRGFQSVVRSLIGSKELTMRDLQKMAPTLIAAKEFSPNYFSPHSAAITFASNGLLPSFIIIAYSDPELWRKIKDANQYEYVYEYLKDIEGIHEFLNYILSGFKSEDEESEEINRRQFIIDICIVLFSERPYDSLVQQAEGRLGMGSNIRSYRKQLVDFDFD